MPKLVTRTSIRRKSFRLILELLEDRLLLASSTGTAALGPLPPPTTLPHDVVHSQSGNDGTPVAMSASPFAAGAGSLQHPDDDDDDSGEEYRSASASPSQARGEGDPLPGSENAKPAGAFPVETGDQESYAQSYAQTE